MDTQRRQVGHPSQHHPPRPVSRKTMLFPITLHQGSGSSPKVIHDQDNSHGLVFADYIVLVYEEKE